MATTLTRSATTLTLPEDLLWIDEFSWQAVLQDVRYSVTGALIRESAGKTKGRTITLQGDATSAWITRATLETLRQWAAIPGESMSLVVRSEAARTVVFDHAAGAIAAAPVADHSDPVSTDLYGSLVLRFIET